MSKDNYLGEKRQAKFIQLAQIFRALVRKLITKLLRIKFYNLGNPK